MDCKNVRSMGSTGFSLQTTYFLDTYLKMKALHHMTLPPLFLGGKSRFLNAKSYGSSLEGFSPQREFMKFWVAVIYCNDPPCWTPSLWMGPCGLRTFSHLWIRWKGAYISGWKWMDQRWSDQWVFHPKEYLRNIGIPHLYVGEILGDPIFRSFLIGKMVVPPWNGGTLAV